MKSQEPTSDSCEICSQTQIIPLDNDICLTCDETTKNCYNCDERKPNEDMQEIASNFYCDDCKDTLFIVCADCEEIRDNEDTGENCGGEIICESCRDNYSICEDCSRVETNDDICYIEGAEKSICESCRNDNYSYCDECNEWNYEDNTSSATNSRGREVTICNSCREGNYYFCNGCDELMHGDRLRYDEETDEDRCDDCNEAQEAKTPKIILDYSAKPKPEFKTVENDTDANKFFALEIENECKGDRNPVAESIKKDFWYFKHDGSLENGFEIVTHPMTIDYLKEKRNEIAEAMETLRKAGSKSYDTKTCGIHIHINREQVNNTWHLFRIMKFFAENKLFILRISQRIEENLVRWAKLDDNNKTELIRKAKAKICNGDRYTAINLNNKNTIEFRIFRGTLNVNSIYKNIQFVSSLIEFCRENNAEAINIKNFKEYIFKSEDYKDLQNFITVKNL